MRGIVSRMARRMRTLKAMGTRGEKHRGLPWDDAVQLVGEEPLVRAAKSKSALSTWRHHPRGVPWGVLGPLVLASRAPEPVRTVPTWQRREWQQRRRYTQAIECLARLYASERYREIGGIAALLASLVQWSDDDWRQVFEWRLDHYVRDARAAIASERRTEVTT